MPTGADSNRMRAIKWIPGWLDRYRNAGTNAIFLHGQCLSRSTYKEDRQGIVKRILERVCPMEKILRIPFTEIDTADLLVDAVYEGGTAKNLGSEGNACWQFWRF